MREQGIFARGHLLFSSNIPISRLELEFSRLVPCRTTPIILCDGGERKSDLANLALSKVRSSGYINVEILKGGTAGWENSGYKLFSGLNVLSKSFGEHIEEACQTPRITPSELLSLQKRGNKLVILDSRPAQEFERMSIPDAINVPGAELVYRIRDIAPEPDTLIVINCAGRTRSIIGTQSLINAELPNEVVALKNGTMGWLLAGLILEEGCSRVAAKPSPPNLKWAQAAAKKVANRSNVKYIDWDTLNLWIDQSTNKTLYLLDVRSPEEYQSGHIPHSRSAPGGQLVQATDSFIATHGAKIVLLDDDQVRANMTASWLNQMGRKNVHVLQDSIAPLASEKGPEPPIQLDSSYHNWPTISARDLFPLLKKDKIRILDFADSRAYKKGHITGAWFTIRHLISKSLKNIPRSDEYILTSPSGVLAELAAPEVQKQVQSSVKILKGGTKSWEDAGFDLASGAEHMASQPDDVYLLPYDHEPEEAEIQMRNYLSWETNLLPQIKEDGSAHFSIIQPPSK